MNTFGNVIRCKLKIMFLESFNRPVSNYKRTQHLHYAENESRHQRSGKNGDHVLIKKLVFSLRN